jgi:hypothetical protein
MTAPARMFEGEPEIEAELAFPGDSAPKIAEARGRLVKTEKMLSHIESSLIAARGQSSDVKKKAEARASDGYRQAIQNHAIAAAAYERLWSLREAASMKIDAWRTAAANRRA